VIAPRMPEAKTTAYEKCPAQHACAYPMGRAEKVGLNAGNTFSIRGDQDALCQYRGAGKPSSIELPVISCVSKRTLPFATSRLIHADDLVYGSLRRPCWASPSRD
jgi:hypothetical protein